MSDQPSFTVDEFEKLLECGQCSKVPQFVPINQCIRGHIVCYACQAHQSRCQKCGLKLGKNRSLVAEQMLEKYSTPCHFDKLGCQARLVPSNKDLHLGSCRFRKWLHCPVPKCEMSMDLSDLKDHLLNVHYVQREISVSTTIGSCSRRVQVTEDLFQRSSKWPSALFFVEPDFFLLMIIRDSNGLWHFWTYGSGTDQEMSQFISKVRVFSGDNNNKTSFSYEGSVVSIFEPVEDTINNCVGLILIDEAIKKVLKDGDRFLFEVVVSK